MIEKHVRSGGAFALRVQFVTFAPSTSASHACSQRVHTHMLYSARVGGLPEQYRHVQAVQ